MYHLFPLYHSRILKNLNTLHICRVRLLQQGESQAVGAVSLTIQSCNFNLMPYNSCLYTTESSRHILLCLCRCSDGYGNHKKFALKSAKIQNFMIRSLGSGIIYIYQNSQYFDYSISPLWSKGMFQRSIKLKKITRHLIYNQVNNEIQFSEVFISDK